MAEISLQQDAGTIATGLVAAAEEVMDVESVRRPLATEPARVGPLRREATLDIRGHLRFPPDQAYDLVSERFRTLGHIALFRRSPDGDVILAVPGSLSAPPGRAWVAPAMFVASVASVLWVGAMYEQAPGQALSLLAGWPFALALLGILVAHEMGHYVVARVMKVPTSLPYFIPLPLPPFGTMGAVMQMKAPPRNRRQLLAVGAAGPLAGLVVAIPVLLLGLSMSAVQTIPVGAPTFQEGNSLLYAALKFLMFGQLLPSGGVDVMVSPVALAGWGGLLVTALNLIPAGQLDGGHVLYSLLGERARIVTYGVIVVLLGLGLLWQGWFLWAGLTFLLGRVHAIPLDDITPLRARERLLIAAMLLIAALVFVPIPMAFSD